VNIQKAGKFKCTIGDYNAYPAVRNSLLKTLIQKSPAHYKYELDNPRQPTPAMIAGEAIHAAALEPKLFKENTVVQPIFEGRTAKGEITTSMNAKEVREQYDRWHFKMTNENKRIVTQDQYDNIAGVLKSLANHPGAVRLMSDGYAEESFIWQDPETGLWCKSRPDFYREGHLVVQLKSTEDAKWESFRKDIVNNGYHIGAAMEMDALTAVMGRPFDEYIIIAVERSAPWGVQCFQLGERTLQEGQELFYKGLKTLKQCQDTGIFPAYADDVVYTDIPDWGFKGEV
jgi:hypothetical protein